jgi:DNA-binding transcriptional ArsR family regulator
VPESHDQPAVQVTDVRALRALAHPLRNRLLAHLRLHGPATSSGLARAVGESRGATSYHLRRLAAYGFVEEVEGRGTQRERWWRARHRVTSWHAADLAASEGAEAVEAVEAEMTRLQIDQHARVLDAWHAQQALLPREWAEAVSIGDYALRMRPDQARALADELAAVVARWLVDCPTEVPAEGSELVFVLTDVVPVREWAS